MSTLGTIHLIFASLALVMGAMVLLLRKGTRHHRTIGHFYFTSMLALNLTALFIYNLFGRFGPFHALAIVSLVTLLGGMIPNIARWPRKIWLEFHAIFMLWSYVGLLAAAVAEVTSRLPGLPFAPAVIAPSLIVSVIGGVLIHTRVFTIIRRM